jgi:ribonucleotide reductase beta subunit family protein with ferritin-like domain
MQKHNNSGIIINSLSYNTEMKKGGVNRKMFFGTEGNAKLIYPVVFPEWKDLTAKARSNHWIPEEILMDTDAEQHQTLPEHMRRAYEMMLSYLTASDILVPTYPSSIFL